MSKIPTTGISVAKTMIYSLLSGAALYGVVVVRESVIDVLCDRVVVVVCIYNKTEDFL
jgi:hypothetical protein